MTPEFKVTVSTNNTDANYSRPGGVMTGVAKLHGGSIGPCLSVELPTPVSYVTLDIVDLKAILAVYELTKEAL